MKNNIQGLIIGFVLGISSFLYFRYIAPYHICFKEHIQLFVFNSSYVFSYFSKPAAFAWLGGDFLTQFLYFKGGGAMIIALLLVAEWLLVFMVFKRFFVKQYALLWSLLPVIVEWIFLPQISFSLALSVSFILALAVFILYERINRTVGIILIPILYMIAGASVFLFLILIILYDIHCRHRRWVYWMVISGLAIAIPFIFRHSFLLTLKQAYCYPFPDFWKGLSIVTMATVILLFICFKKPVGAFRPVIFQTVTIIIMVSILVTGLVKTTDKEQEKLLGITIEAYHNNWDKVLDIAEKAELNNPVTTCFTNIALSRKNLLGDRLMDFYQPFSAGLLLPGRPGPNWFATMMTNDAYFHIGDMDMAQHAAMVGMISLPRQRSARMIERLAEINMATGDIPAATKYSRMLESTLFHKTKLESRITNSTQRSEQRIFKKDTIRKATDIKLSLELLAESNQDDLPAINYLLCYYLLNKDIPSFFRAYTSYGKGQFTPVPKVYAEALLVYFAATKSSIDELTMYGIQPEMIKAFGEYTRLYEKSEGDLPSMQEKFPNTYWLFYHFAVMNN